MTETSCENVLQVRAPMRTSPASVIARAERFSCAVTLATVVVYC